MDWFNGTPTGNGCFLSLNQSAPTGNMCLIFNGFQWICLCFSIAIFNNKKNWDEHMKSSAAAGENCTSCSYLDLPIGGPWPRISCDEIGPYEGPSRLHLGCDMAATCDERDPLAGSTWDDFRWKNHLSCPDDFGGLGRPKSGQAEFWWLIDMIAPIHCT